MYMHQVSIKLYVVTSYSSILPSQTPSTQYCIIVLVRNNKLIADITTKVSQQVTSPPTKMWVCSINNLYVVL